MRQRPGPSERQAPRFDIALPAAARVSPQHAAAVRCLASSGPRARALDMQAVDIARGGLGLVSRVFLPRRTILDIRVHGIGERSEEILLHTQVRVQRVVMTDRRPAYLVGAAFVHLDDEVRKDLRNLLAIVGDEEAA